MRDADSRINGVLDALSAAGGKPYLVGGCVRDAMLGQDPKDIDVEVYHLSLEEAESALSPFNVSRAGVRFGVLALGVDGLDMQVSLPRRDSKVGPGHSGFAVTFEPDMPLHEAAARRDYTINAMYYDPTAHEVIDPFGGQSDLQSGVLRNTSDAFAEDPARVLRGMQLAGRLRLTMNPVTAALCSTLIEEGRSLNVDTVWQEWWKWATKSQTPSMGLKVLVDTHWDALYEGFSAMRFTRQDAKFHPEGSVWVHTANTVDAAARIAVREGLNIHERGVLVLAALLHDIAKPEVTEERQDETGVVRVVSPGHAEAGFFVAQQFLEGIGAPKAVIAEVAALVRCHMRHLGVGSASNKARAVLRLALDVAPSSIKMLSYLVEADGWGRLSPAGAVAASVLMQIAEANQAVEAPTEEIIKGRHVVALGVRPGPEVGRLVRDAYGAQIEGEFSTLEEGIAWLRSRLS